MLADLGLDLAGQARGEVAAGEIEFGIEQREGAAFPGQFDRIEIGAVAHEFGDAGGHGAGHGLVVTQAQHGQGIAEASVAKADAALVGGFLSLALERPMGGVEDVVEHAGRHANDFGETVEIEAGLVGEDILDEQRQVDRPQAAAAIRRQRLLGAGIGGLDHFAVVEVVVLVHPVEEEDAGLGMIVGGFHDLVPQVAGAQLAVDPHAVVALVGARLLHVGIGFGAMKQLDIAIAVDRFHEGIGNADRNVEIGQVAMILGVDEVLDVRMVAAQHAHLGATPGAGRFDGLAGAVEDTHVRHRAGSARLGTLDVGPLRADARKVIADTAAAAHGFGGLGECRVDAGLAVDGFDDRIAHWLHEAVDQRGMQIGAGGGVDAAGRDETAFLGPQEARFPLGAILFRFDLGKRVGDPAAHVVDVSFLALRIFFDQHLAGNLLLGEWGELRRGGDVGQRELFGNWAHGMLLGMVLIVGL